LGYSWDEVHEEAERLEHAITAHFCLQLEKILGNPQTDPHGDPIPNAALERPVMNQLILNELRAGDRGQITRVANDDVSVLQEAGRLNLRPGTTFERLEGSPLTLRLLPSNRSIKIAPHLGNKIFVKLL
jgi:DtxR family Mn-dependent transcriptional regulator